MPVRVVGPDPDEPDRGTEPVVQRRVLIGGSVVRDLDDVDRSRRVRAGTPEPTLRALVQVPEEERRRTPVASPAGLDTDDEAGLVPAHRRRRRRPHDSPRQTAERSRRADGATSDVGAARAERLDHPGVLRPAVRTNERDPDPIRDRADGSHVIGVEVGRDEHVDPPDAEQPETRPEPFGVVPGVDEHHGTAVADEHGVALTDVAHPVPPVRRHAPAQDGDRDGDHPDPDHEHRRHRCTRHRSDAIGPKGRHTDRDGDDGGQDDPEQPG
jgi:hypothetical protein